jgi:hypothetical protein
MESEWEETKRNLLYSSTAATQLKPSQLPSVTQQQLSSATTSVNVFRNLPLAISPVNQAQAPTAMDAKMRKYAQVIQVLNQHRLFLPQQQQPKPFPLLSALLKLSLTLDERDEVGLFIQFFDYCAVWLSFCCFYVAKS